MTKITKPAGGSGGNWCPACKREHRTLSGKPVPFCSAHVDPEHGDCDERGSHLCGPSELSMAMAKAFPELYRRR